MFDYFYGVVFTKAYHKEGRSGALILAHLVFQSEAPANYSKIVVTIEFIYYGSSVTFRYGSASSERYRLSPSVIITKNRTIFLSSIRASRLNQLFIQKK